VLENQAKSQTLNIYVAPEREVQVRDRLEAMVQSMRRKQNWVILPEPALGPLQCRIEWTGGGAEWDPEAVANTLLQTIISHLPEHLRAEALPDENALPDAAIDDSAEKTHTNEVPQGE